MSQVCTYLQQAGIKYFIVLECKPPHASCGPGVMTNDAHGSYLILAEWWPVVFSSALMASPLTMFWTLMCLGDGLQG